VILDAAGGRIDGRTVVQKMAYFAANALGEDLGHHAHYYGPYSREVERALTHSALSEDVHETVERFPGWRGGPDGRQYHYELTGQGKDLVTELRRRYSDECGVIDAIVARLDRAVPSRNQHTLSLAAKTHLILSQQPGTPVRDVPELARALNWEMSEGDLAQAVEVLKQVSTVRE
jgi:uncharacterized protein YwgA